MREPGTNWKFLLLMLVAYISTNINLQGFLALMPFLQADLGLSRTQAGLYSTFFFLSTIFLAFLSGRLVDKAGSKRSMVLGISCVGSLMLLHSLAINFTILLVLAFLTGIGFSVVAPAVNKGVMEMVLPQNRAFSMGIIQSGVGVGGFLGAVLLPFLGKFFGWRRAVLFPGILALLLALVIFKLFEKERGGLKKNTNLADKTGSLKGVLLNLFKNKKLMAISYLCLIFGIVQGFLITHYILFLNQDISLSETLSGLALGIMQIGGLIGQLFWGWFSDYFFAGNRRIGVLIIGLSCTLTVLISAIAAGFSMPLLMILVLAFFLGLSGMGWMGLFFTIVGELAGKAHTGTAFGFALFFMRLGIVLGPPVLGYFSDLKGSYSLSWIIIGFSVTVFTVYFSLVDKRKKVSVMS
ncbi:MAG: transporter, family, hexuronate transporter [Halanaerobiales bacterium]|nr:transporter, family, hexuronate transporter [Halanaerobiales bacterium]